eukprot:CAMPEP_0198648846 /NCGR_PEP_ID=MMETSP1467-20131203/3814_1 /TAXON_ID=1462469 /ORGANISM="unid. sp., Strain CCMP2135" /LENGTH=127 /DNA_ID=CAMNT_0044384593 /DNA_START=392 /DNA_END=773 /DNA_ORIENTATION=+
MSSSRAKISLRLASDCPLKSRRHQPSSFVPARISVYGGNRTVLEMEEEALTVVKTSPVANEAKKTLKRPDRTHRKVAASVQKKEARFSYISTVAGCGWWDENEGTNHDAGALEEAFGFADHVDLEAD